jgi:hypothetical protein
MLVSRQHNTFTRNEAKFSVHCDVPILISISCGTRETEPSDDAAWNLAEKMPPLGGAASDATPY